MQNSRPDIRNWQWEFVDVLIQRTIHAYQFIRVNAYHHFGVACLPVSPFWHQVWPTFEEHQVAYNGMRLHRQPIHQRAVALKDFYPGGHQPATCAWVVY